MVCLGYVNLKLQCTCILVTLVMRYMYRIAGNFRGVQFLWMGDLVTFHVSIFVDANDCAIVSMYKCAYFTGLIFAVHETTVKTTKIGPLENFPPYSMLGSHGIAFCIKLLSSVHNYCIMTNVCTCAHTHTHAHTHTCTHTHTHTHTCTHTHTHTHTQSNALKHYPSVPSQTLNVLQTQLKAVVSKLPEDLQSCLKTAFSET